MDELPVELIGIAAARLDLEPTDPAVSELVTLIYNRGYQAGVGYIQRAMLRTLGILHTETEVIDG